jgi:hypothetical protein
MAGFGATDIYICNLAGGKLGGFGNQVSATGEISNLTATDRITVACAREYPRARQQVIVDLALMRAPIRETVKNAELDDELTGRDVVIADIVSSGNVVTVTTDEVHEKSTGDTVVLKGIDAASGVGAADVGVLNGQTYTITVVDTLNFTLDNTTGNDSFDYTADSGIVSEAPELGPWGYAFDMPSAAIAAIRVMDEEFTNDEDTRREHRFGTMLNRDDDGLIITTNELTNADGDGIYLEYAIDQTDESLFSLYTVDAIATLLASFLAPVVGRNTDVRVAQLAEYRNVSLPDAAAFNNSQINRRAKARTDFRGGRNSVLPQIL